MPRVLIVEPNAPLRADLLHLCVIGGYETRAVANINRGLDNLRADHFEVVLVDVQDTTGIGALARVVRGARGARVVAMSPSGSHNLALGAMRAGAGTFLRKPFSAASLEEALTGREMLPHDILAGEDPAMAPLRRCALDAVETDATLLVSGESGTGKHTLVRSLHRYGRRRNGPLVRCSLEDPDFDLAQYLNPDVEPRARCSEAQAAQSVHGGTLVLDDVAKATQRVQMQLLELLQHGRATRADGLTRSVDARIVAITRSELDERVASGALRADLHHRLRVLELRIPPLRERIAELPTLAQTLLTAHAARSNTPPPELGDEALDRLALHPFRGNLRELDNLMQRAALLFPGRPIDARVLLEERSAQAQIEMDDGPLNLRTLERATIRRSLQRFEGNRTRAAEALGISVRTLRNKIRAYDLR